MMYADDSPTSNDHGQYGQTLIQEKSVRISESGAGLVRRCKTNTFAVRKQGSKLSQLVCFYTGYLRPLKERIMAVNALMQIATKGNSIVGYTI